MQAVLSFTFTRSPSPRSAAIHQIKPGPHRVEELCQSHHNAAKKKKKEKEKAAVEAKRLVEGTACQLFL